MDTTLAGPPADQLLDGRYRVRSTIAHGGMATVYLATDTRLDREVAVKVMHADLARDAALPDVPFASDFALNEEKRQILHLWLAPNVVARPLALPPAVPPDRLTAIRQAFIALFQDPRFLSDARTSGMSVDPRAGEFIENLVRELRALPPSTIEAAKAAASD